jgi:hypothetical protein
MIKSEDHLLDATVVPANMEYPTDAKLLNRARQWVVKAIRVIRRRCDVKGKVRTYCRKAQAAYLGISKSERRRRRHGAADAWESCCGICDGMSASWRNLLRAHGERLKAKERTVS